MHFIPWQGGGYKGKIKLIYIDPPFNTGNDSFLYNDNFNRSTYLTFTKNRVEVAKSLLSKDGVFLLHCSFHEYAYLKVLLNDIFETHLCDFHIQVRHPKRILTGDKEFNDLIEHILIFSNNRDKKMPKIKELKTNDDYIYEVEIKDHEEPSEIINCDGKKVEVYYSNQYQVKKCQPHKELLRKISIGGSIREKNSSGRFYVKYLENQSYPPQTLFKVPDMGADELGFRFFRSPGQNNKNGIYYQGTPLASNVTEKPYPNFYDFEKDYNRVAKEGSIDFRLGKKPEKLMNFLIDIFTSENDIVLDYHIGSGTTCAVAHKMNRRYIGIEQMDYIQDITLKRLVAVIEGENEGISKEINWSGGGSFIYTELAESMPSFLERVSNADEDACTFLWNELKKSPYTSYRVDFDKEDADSEFKQLTLEDKKQILLNIIDKNMYYIPYSEIDNKDFVISKGDKAMSEIFYSRID